MNAALEYKTLHITKAMTSGEFEAVIATLGVVDSDGDIIMPGAFAGATVSIMPAHNHGSVPLGKAKMQDRGDEAIAVGQFNLDIQSGKEWHSALKLDLENPPSVQEWSFGFNVLDSEDDMRDGKPVRILKRLDVMEISPVLRGAGVDTRTLAVKSGNDDRTIDEFIQAGERLYDIFSSATPQQQQHYAPRVVSLLNRYMQVSEALLDGKSDRTFSAIDGKFGFVYCDNFGHLETAKALAAAFAKSLGFATPTIELYRDAEAGERADFCYDRKSLGGIAFVEQQQIKIRDCFNFADMVEVIAHETFHCFQKKNKDFDYYNKSIEQIEEGAVAYGKRVARELNIPGYAEFRVGVPPREMHGSANALFYFSPTDGEVYKGRGWNVPFWETWGDVDMSLLEP